MNKASFRVENQEILHHLPQEYRRARGVERVVANITALFAAREARVEVVYLKKWCFLSEYRLQIVRIFKLVQQVHSLQMAHGLPKVAHVRRQEVLADDFVRPGVDLRKVIFVVERVFEYFAAVQLRRAVQSF